ncbi:MAG TPA: hypothetical protein VGD57_00180 [Candidatus Dormibacteraeota bacterium]|jgi:hypothetical protein
MRKAVQAKQDYTCDSLIVTDVPPTPLPAPFLTALAGREEILVSSREADREGTVSAWFVLSSASVVYLFADAHSVRMRRWRADPWVRLTLPGTSVSAEGAVQVVPAAEIDAELGELVVERWGMWGAATAPGLRRMVRDGSHVLLRVSGL